MDDEFAESLIVTDRYLDTSPIEPEKSLAQVWKVRALLGLARKQEAIGLFREVDDVFQQQKDDRYDQTPKKTQQAMRKSYDAVKLK